MRLYLHQLRAEQRLFWRTREAAIFTFLLPIVLFLLLGQVYDDEIDGKPSADVLLAGMLAYGLANTAFSGLAITLIVRRELGSLKRLRSTPLPPAHYFAALLSSMLIVYALQSATLIALGRVLYDANPPEAPLALIGALVLGAVAMAALGLGTAGLVRSGEGSSAVISIIVLPMAFLSGSFGSTDDYPEILQAIGSALPLKYALELIEDTSLEGSSLWQPQALAVLAIWLAAGVFAAWRWFGWEPRSA